MIRLPPTMIMLGRSDLKDYERRRRRRKAFDANSGGVARQSGNSTKEYREHLISASHCAGTIIEGTMLSQSAIREKKPYRNLSVPTTIDLRDYQSGDSVIDTSLNSRSLATEQRVDGQSNASPGGDVSPENTVVEAQDNLTASKDDFQYGGFFHSSNQISFDLPQRSSPFTPDDVSTPQNAVLLDSRGIRGRLPLPRSPLFISQNASSSPEHRHMAGLTPRVVSRVATHQSPGILFSQRPRRPPRRSTRNFRHQTNSFSFDSSERASAAYEQERISSTSTTESTPRPPDNLSLHEELRGSSLHGSRASSESYSSPPRMSSADSPPFAIQRELREEVINEGEFSVSSPLLPKLPLPPPFSVSSRVASGTEILPSTAAKPVTEHPITSPLYQFSTSPLVVLGSGEDLIVESGRAPDSPVVLSQILDSSPGSLLQRAARALSFYRSRTPSTPTTPHKATTQPSSSSPTPRTRQSHRSRRLFKTRTPSGSYRVYDDTMPPASQPQTPAHLPEARHQSRFHPAYTAPLERHHRMPEIDSGRHVGRRRTVRPATIATPSRRGMGRTASPVGLLAEGFAGLYGGRENGDGEYDWTQGIRFSNVETRLWGLREARDEGRSLHETPEPEDWRAERR